MKTFTINKPTTELTEDELQRINKAMEGIYRGPFRFSQHPICLSTKERFKEKVQRWFHMNRPSS